MAVSAMNMMHMMCIALFITLYDAHIGKISTQHPPPVVFLNHFIVFLLLSSTFSFYSLFLSCDFTGFFLLLFDLCTDSIFMHVF